MNGLSLPGGARLRCVRRHRAGAALVFSHGAGAGTGHPWYGDFAAALLPWKGSLYFLDFPARAAGRRAPDPFPVMVESACLAAAEVAVNCPGPVFLGGRSMGGRVAAAAVERAASGGLAVGYPLAPPSRPEQRDGRARLLQSVRCPFAVVQGSRDPFGDAQEIRGAKAGRRNVKVWSVAGGGHGLDNRREHLVPGAAGALLEALAWLEARTS